MISFSPESGLRMRTGWGSNVDRHGFRALLPRALHYFFKHVAVSAMNAVKVPDTDHGRAEVCRNVLEFVEDLHQNQLLASGSGF